MQHGACAFSRPAFRTRDQSGTETLIEGTVGKRTNYTRNMTL